MKSADQHKHGDTHATAAAFTLVELMIAMFSAAVLALTAGVLLYYAYVGWSRNLQTVDMQRDATVAMTRLSRLIREAAAVNTTLSGSRLTIAHPGGATASVYQNGASLVYDPDTAQSGNEQVLVGSHVTGFVPSAYSEGLRIQLALGNGYETIQMDSILAYRNAN